MPRIAPRSRPSWKFLLSASTPVRPSWTPSAEEERQQTAAEQEEALIARETAQAAARRAHARDLHKQLADLEAEEEQVWRAGGNTNAMRQSRLELVAKRQKIDAEAADIERRVQDPEYRARTNPVCRPAS